MLIDFSDVLQTPVKVQRMEEGLGKSEIMFGKS
jgi:hypothetical protein